MIALLFVLAAALARHPDEKVILAPLAKGKLKVFGEEIDAKPWCNEETLGNVDQAEVYAGGGGRIALLCTGSMDGGTNVVTVFKKGARPKSEKVEPLSSSHRITDEVLGKTIKALAK